jgi:hypothetical protein
MALATPARLPAQLIGHPPESSPYRDVESGHELAIFGGYFAAARDPAGVAPRAAPAVGIRESIHLSGPAMFFVRLTHTFSDREVINPAEPRASRDLGTRKDALTMFDLGLGLNLTGDRSWHNIVPSINAGAGLVSDLGAPHDIGGYRFGNQLAIVYGGGFRWVTPGRLSLRINADNYMYTHKYPATYRQVTVDGTSVLPPTHSLSAWRNNGMYTVGVSYALFH